MQGRRHFLVLWPAVALGVTAARAAEPAAVDEKDPTAAGLGYVSDAARADKARFKQYAAGQACSNCQLFQGAASAAQGACPIYAGKLVSAKGWCSAYAKKA